MKYKVGDRLQVKKFKEYCYPKHWTAEMMSYSGENVTIEYVNRIDYRLKEYNYYWDDGDFEAIVEMNKFESEEFEIK